MEEVRVYVGNNDRYVAAMVKALAWEIETSNAVRGASHEQMEQVGYLTFPFSTPIEAEEFRRAVRTYLPAGVASVGIPHEPPAAKLPPPTAEQRREARERRKEDLL